MLLLSLSACVTDEDQHTELKHELDDKHNAEPTVTNREEQPSSQTQSAGANSKEAKPEVPPVPVWGTNGKDVKGEEVPMDAEPSEWLITPEQAAQDAQAGGAMLCENDPC